MHELLKGKLVDNYLECYGDLNLADPICRKYCALRLKCAIEKIEQNRLIQLEDLINVQEIPLKVQ
ncbi:MAG: hypothetical protein J7K96_08080 [Desulfobacteraceae bacterium]|nr:hypothetical protein [Desulfobacteraceae bacterium]